MINNILLAAAVSIPVTALCAPVLAENVTSPAQKQVSAPVNAAFGGLGEVNTPPALTLSVRGINNNIACRNAARSKYFELGARDMSASDSNTQWGTVGNMQAVVWCRDSYAVIGVAGQNNSSVVELRDAVAKAF